MSDSLRKRLLAAAGGLAVAVGLAGGASAAPVFGAITLAGGNDGLDDIYGAGVTTRNGWYGADLYLVGGPADIDVQYLGKEAGNTNSFNFLTASFTTSGGTQFNAGGIGPTQTVNNVASALLNFSFSTSSPAGSVQNGSNNALTTPNFFISFGNENAAGGTIAYLWLDDNNTIDDNHDDMVIRLSISDGTFAIPLPAAAWLMIAGIGGLGLVARRRRTPDA